MTNTINKRKNSIDLSDVIHNIRKNSTDSIDSRSYSTDENTPRTPRRSNSIEIKIDISETDFIKLRNANDVYLDIYKKARTKAKNARNNAIKAYLEVKRIKELYMLDVIDSSDEEENEETEE